jgi:hypothetical protein
MRRAVHDRPQLLNPATGKVLDVFGKSLLDLAKVCIWTDNGGLNQQWTVTAVTGGHHKLINRNSGKVLDVATVRAAGPAAVRRRARRAARRT